MSRPAFELKSTTSIASLGLELRQYEHAATGARHLHFACNDPNNAFMVVLPTLPEDSTGVAHILEHTALCGSRRYPVRDPFFMMLRRSLNTFMNAFTGSDSTAYPFATQNRKDFDNLLGVYLDAVFFPRLDALDFAQEGWRVELSPGASAAAPALEYHGVVFNEMKGAMSSPLAQLWQHLHAALFPDTLYRHNSGGEPLAIPDLTHEALRAFHARHYHPGHAVFMTYGSFPESEHQARIEDLVLGEFQRPQAPLIATPQPRFAAPRELETVYFNEEEDERATHVAWAWLLGEAAEPEDVVAAHLLSSMLLEHSASPLRHFLETTELADAPSELCGVDDSARQLVFICGVEGSEPEHARALEDGILAVLERVARDGVDASELNAVLDRIELAQRDLGAGSYPFGLQVMGRVMPAAMYRRDPARLLELDRVLEGLRRDIREAGFAERLVRRLLLDNPHRVRVVMSPDAGKAERDLAAERERLAALAAALDEAELAALADKAEALRVRQAQVDDPAILPRVTLADVPPPVPAPRPESSVENGVEVHSYACAANGIFRAQLVFDLPPLTAEELRVLPLFADYLTEFGCGDEDYLAVQTRRALVGSFGTNTMARPPVTGGDLQGWFVLSGKGLARKRDQVLDVLNEILAGARFDETERLAELLLQSRAEAEQSITERGHQLAVLSAAREFSPAAALDDLWDGPTSIRLLKDLAARDDEAALRALLATFTAIRDKLAHAPRRVALFGDAAVLAGAAPRAAAVGAPRAPLAAPFEARMDASDSPAGWLAAAQVNFLAKAYAAMPEDHPDAPLLTVLGRYLQDGYLHGAIREKGGAYGSGAGYDPDSATFRFHSYRDPRAAATLADFDQALTWFASDTDAQRLEEAILGTIRALDQPRSPVGEAERAFINGLYGRDDAFRQRYRARALAANHAALRKVAARYLDPARGRTGAVCGAGAEAELAAGGLAFGKL
ncbi:MAG: insulinase family protein [Gammaproteobacteria bacterium]